MIAIVTFFVAFAISGVPVLTSAPPQCMTDCLFNIPTDNLPSLPDDVILTDSIDIQQPVPQFFGEHQENLLRQAENFLDSVKQEILEPIDLHAPVVPYDNPLLLLYPEIEELNHEPRLNGVATEANDLPTPVIVGIANQDPLPEIAPPHNFHASVRTVNLGNPYPILRNLFVIQGEALNR